MNTRKPAKQAGFTMIELILTLILAGLAGSMILPFFQSGITESGTPIYRLESLSQLETTMANITAAVRAPSASSSAQNPYQVRGGGMQALKNAIENDSTFKSWVPDGVTITPTTDGPFKLGTKAKPTAIGDAYDQNYVLQVTLTAADGTSLTHYFCEGTNYQKEPENGWGGSGS